MDRTHGNPHYAGNLCKEVLAMHALLGRDAKMLKAVLDEHHDNIPWPFHQEYDRIIYKPSAIRVVCVVRMSKFRSIVPRRKRFRDLHTWDYMD
jgi:hypothetical protein